jgi:hypothetical protein
MKDQSYLTFPPGGLGIIAQGRWRTRLRNSLRSLVARVCWVSEQVSLIGLSAVSPQTSIYAPSTMPARAGRTERSAARGLRRPSDDWYHPPMRTSLRARMAQQAVWVITWVTILAFVLSGSTLAEHDPLARIRRFTHTSEFDFAGWTLSALGVKVEQSSLGTAGYLTTDDREALVRKFLDLTHQIDELEARQLELTDDPSSSEDSYEAASISEQLQEARGQLSAIQPDVETILQEQEAVVLAELGLNAGGLALPPVSFHLTRLPLSVIISPRETIRQDASIQLNPNITLAQQVTLENQLEGSLGVSALVVPLGGIGTYPTMVQESNDLAWLAEVIAHEWAHNYLFFRPLGFVYETDLDMSPEVRTMNETAASLFGKAVSEMVLERYYPDLLPPPSTSSSSSDSGGPPGAFDFRAEMHVTRLEVDALLARGMVDEAGAYMEARRRVFWDHGYHIRRLNQAYFAFYGAYADEPGGAAGVDPVGEAVRALWQRSRSPAEFLKKIGWIRNYAELQRALEDTTTTTR